jgi:hypothetical protein
VEVLALVVFWKIAVFTVVKPAMPALERHVVELVSAVAAIAHFFT